MLGQHLILVTVEEVWCAFTELLLCTWTCCKHMACTITFNPPVHCDRGIIIISVLQREIEALRDEVIILSG